MEGVLITTRIILHACPVEDDSRKPQMKKAHLP